MSDAIPLAPFPLAARAPGKCIVFGEHAVVHGGPELALAIDLELQVGLRSAPEFQLGGEAAAARDHPYLQAARRTLWDDAYGGVAVEVVSRIPRAAGLGSSAAFCAALATGLSAARGGIERSMLAERAFAVERGAQGVGSPGDTSAVVAGGYVAINGGGGAILWELKDEARTWRVRRVADPGWLWFVASSGVPRSTATAVRAVSARLAQVDGPKLLERFADVATRGIDAVAREDRAAIGPLLNENHALLQEVGVSHPRVEALRDALLPAAEGVKITGAGAGGSVVALIRPGQEVDAVRRARSVGGRGYVVRASPHGARLVTSGR